MDDHEDGSARCEADTGQHMPAFGERLLEELEGQRSGQRAGREREERGEQVSRRHPPHPGERAGYQSP